MKNISAATSSSLNTSEWDLPFKVKGIIWCGVFAMESICVVIGNLLTIVLFASSRKLRKKSLLIAINMAFADAMIGIVCLPLHIYVNIGRAYQLWTPDTSLGIMFHITQTVFGQASLISSALISGERFFAIYWPLKHQILPVQAYYVAISIIWALSIILTTVFIALFLLTSTDHAFYTLMPWFLTLLIIVCLCNSGIIRKFRLRSNTLRQRSRGTLNRRLTTTLLFVSMVAFLSWFPKIIIMISRVQVSKYVHDIAFLLLYFNSLVNPVVYALRIAEFRQALVLCCLRRKSKLDGQTDRWSIRSTHRRMDRLSDRMSSPLTPGTQVRTLIPQTCHLRLALEDDKMETKL